MHVAVANTHRQPVTIDDEGHQLGGGEYAAVDDSSERIKTLIDLGHLRVLPRYGTEHPSVSAAYMDADAKNAQADEQAVQEQQDQELAEAKATSEAVLAEANEALAAEAHPEDAAQHADPEPDTEEPA